MLSRPSSSTLELGSSAPGHPYVVKPSIGAGSIGAARYDAGDPSSGDARCRAPRGRPDGDGSALRRGGRRPRRDVAHLHERRVLARSSQGADPHSGREPGRRRALRRGADEPGRGRRARSSSWASACSPRCRSRASELLYARIDVLPGPKVLEVELTEPSLFIGYAEGAAERFAAAIAAASQRRRMSAENGPTTSQ